MSAPKDRANNTNRQYKPKQSDVDWPEHWYATPETIDEMSRYYESEWAKENKKEGK
jgi:hypothetical protein